MRKLFITILIMIGLYTASNAQKRLELPQAERGWYVSGAVRQIYTIWPIFKYGGYQFKTFYSPAVSIGYRLLPYIHPQVDVSFYSQNLEKNPFNYIIPNSGTYEYFEKISFGMIQLQAKMSPIRSEGRIRPYIAPIFLWKPYITERRTMRKDTATGIIIEDFTTEDKGSFRYLSSGIGLQLRVWEQVEGFAELNIPWMWNKNSKPLWGDMGAYVSWNAGINYHFGGKKEEPNNQP